MRAVHPTCTGEPVRHTAASCEAAGRRRHMAHTTPGRWLQWRVKLVSKPNADNGSGFVRKALMAAGEQPGPDGIRHGLVARVRAEIAAGTYDTEERWRAAQERLLDRIEQGV